MLPRDKQVKNSLPENLNVQHISQELKYALVVQQNTENFSNRFYYELTHTHKTREHNHTHTHSLSLTHTHAHTHSHTHSDSETHTKHRHTYSSSPFLLFVADNKTENREDLLKGNETCHISGQRAN